MDHKSKPRSNGVLHFEGDNPHDDGCVQQQNRRTEETLATDTVIIDVAIDVVIATYHDSFYTPTPSNISLFPLPPSPYPIILPLCHTPPQFNLPMMVAGFLCLVLTAAALTFSDSIRQNSLFVKPDRAQSNTRMPDRAQSNTPDLDHVQSNALTLTFFGRIRRFFVWAQSNLFVWAQSNMLYGPSQTYGPNQILFNRIFLQAHQALHINMRTHKHKYTSRILVTYLLNMFSFVAILSVKMLIN